MHTLFTVFRVSPAKLAKEAARKEKDDSFAKCVVKTFYPQSLQVVHYLSRIYSDVFDADETCASEGPRPVFPRGSGR